MKSSWLGVLLWWMTACGGADNVVRVVDIIYPDGRFGFTDVTLTTLTDLDAASGDVAQIFGNVTLDLDLSQPIADAGGSRSRFVAESHAVTLHYVVADGVAIASDLDSLMMLTSYWHFEQAVAHLRALGAPLPLPPVPVYYQPKVKNADELNFPAADNAAFFVPADGFVLLPSRALTDVPLPMNTGVVMHEMAHRLFYYTAWQGQLFAALAAHASDAQAGAHFNRAKATDEGVADFFAAALSHDPAFLGKSTPVDVAQARNLTELRTLDPAWVGGAEPQIEGSYNPYAAGAVVAAALWKLVDIASLGTVEQAVLQAEAELGAVLADSFTYQFGDLERRVLGALPAALQPAACDALALRYASVWSRFASVCP